AFQRNLGLRFRYYRNSQNDRDFPTRGAESMLESTFNIGNWLGLNLVSGVDTLYLESGAEMVPVPVSSIDQLIKSLAPLPHLTVYGRYSKLLKVSPRTQFRPDVAGAMILSTGEDSRVYQDFYVGGYQNIRMGDTKFWGLNYAEVT